jgi:hypothetical protein
VAIHRARREAKVGGALFLDTEDSRDKEVRGALPDHSAEEGMAVTNMVEVEVVATMVVAPRQWLPGAVGLVTLSPVQ